MPFIIALIGIIGAAYYWANRAQNARDVVGDVADMANHVRLAARRFGFSRKMNVHPVESIEDPQRAIATIGSAFIELDDLPTVEQRQHLAVQLRSKLRADAAEAEEMEVLGRGFMSECGGAEPAVARLSRNLYPRGDTEQMEPLMDIFKGSVTSRSDKQGEALEDISRAMGVR